jgi:hypothetical protein
LLYLELLLEKMCRLCTDDYTVIQEDIRINEELTIHCSEIDTVPCFRYLSSLLLKFCFSIRYLPRFSSLRCLELEGCTSILRLHSMPQLIFLKITAGRIREIATMPSLQFLHIRNCLFLEHIRDQPNLIMMSLDTVRKINFRNSRFNSLHSLNLRNCDVYELPSGLPELNILELDDLLMLRKIPHYPNLLYLTIKNCNLVQSIPSYILLSSLIVEQTNNLMFPFQLPENLTLDNLRLVGVYIKELPNIPSITHLEIDNCRELRINQLFPLLTHLTLRNTPYITRIPKNDFDDMFNLTIEHQGILDIFSRFFRNSLGSNDYERNRAKLLLLQCIFRRKYNNRVLRKFLRLTSSTEFAEYFWTPGRMGAQWARSHYTKCLENTPN